LDRAETALGEILARLNSLVLILEDKAVLTRKIEEIDGRLSKERERLSELKDILAERVSATIADLVFATELKISDLEAEKRPLLAELNTEDIEDKAAFLSRLDMNSYSGRYRINSFLKRLGVKIAVSVSERNYLYIVFQNKTLVLSAWQDRDRFYVKPASPIQLEKEKKLDFDNAVHIAITEMIGKNIDLLLPDNEQLLVEKTKDVFRSLGVELNDSIGTREAILSLFSSTSKMGP
jgi:hypothetical protein